jgi:MFS family permease
MSQTETALAASKWGPVRTETGILSRHMWALMFASFVTIGLVTIIASMTPYILTTNLGMPEANQGKALGLLALVQEAILILAFGPLGALADKIGRRAVYCVGLVVLAAAYFIYPYAHSLTELSLVRIIYALGVAAATGILATIIADYGVEQDRGKLTALCGFLNGLGIVLVTVFISRLPVMFVGQGMSDVEAGQATMALAAGASLISGILLWFTLKPGAPSAATAQKRSATALLKEGVAAARANPRIGLAYASAFVARGDLAIVGLFLTAWGKQAAIADGFPPAEALKVGLMPFIIAQSAALLWPAFIAVPLDRMNRVKALGFCMALGALGYCGLIFVSDPVLPAAIPFMVLLGIGQISAFLGAQTIIGKEAPEAARGAVIGLFNFCGAVGILVLTSVGGILFDAYGPWAPFFLVGLLNGVVAIACLMRRRKELRLGVA